MTYNKNRLRPIIFALGLIWMPGKAQAASDTLLDRYLQRAREYHPELQEARAQAAAARHLIKPAGSLPDPALGAGVALNNMTGHGEIALSQRLPWPGKLRARKAGARLSAEALAARADDLQNDIMFRVRLEYARLYALNKKIGYQKEILAYIEQAEAAALKRFAAGNAAQMAVLKLQLERETGQDRIRQLETEAGTARERLGALVDLPADSIALPDRLPVIPVPAYEYAVGIALEQNPQVHALKLEVDAAAAQEALARKERWPDLTAGARYETGDGTVHATAGMTLPVWFRSRSAAVAAAQGRREAAERKLEHEKSDLAAIAGSMHRVYTDAVRQIDLYETSLLPKAQQAVDAAAAYYRTGTVPIADFLDSYRMLLGLRMKLVDLEVKREEAAAEIVICCLGTVIIPDT